MRLIRICLGFGRTANAVTATLAIVLMLVLGVLAVSPSLHRCLHSDSDRIDHFCLISAFASGHLCGAEAISIIATACVLIIYAAFLRETPLVSLFDIYFSPNRAPPRP